MASNLILVMLLVLVSLSLTSGYSLSTRDAVSKQDDESYVMMDQESSIVIVEDAVRSRLLASVARSRAVVVNKAVSRSSPSKSSTRKHRSKKIGSLDVGALAGIIIAAIVVTIVIICVIYFLYLRHETKKAQSPEQETDTEQLNDKSEANTLKTEDV